VLMSLGGSPVGRVLGLRFDAPQRRFVSDGRPGPFVGYWNLNFYVDDIRATCAALERDGWSFWSRPVGHAMAGDAGAPVEAIFLGPDNVAINLVELAGEGGSTVAALRREAAALPRTRTGWTQVSTSAHGTRDATAASAFYREALGMSPAIDTVLESPEVNRITGRPPGARSRVVWMRGAHPYGKVAFSQPLNYAMPDRARDAAAPAIGYLAQGFEVPDLDAALAAAARCGAERAADPERVPLAAGFAPRAAMVRVPGSGALAQLLEAA
jgi:catechol 2,3-dioxygenase-like lactoylglutathione lyase family enzyme